MGRSLFLVALVVLGLTAVGRLDGRSDLSAAAVPKAADRPLQSPLAIVTAARVWTGTATIQNGAVFVRDGKIERVGPRPATLPKDATVIDFPRHTIVPGLVDLHTHMMYFWDGTPGTRPLSQR